MVENEEDVEEEGLDKFSWISIIIYLIPAYLGIFFFGFKTLFLFGITLILMLTDPLKYIKNRKKKKQESNRQKEEINSEDNEEEVISIEE